MSAVTDQIKEKFKRGNGVQKLIYINLTCYVLPLFIDLFSGLLGFDPQLIFSWFALSSNFDVFFFHPWSLVSYGFLHAGFMHLLTNMLVLFYIGNLFIDYFTPKQLYNYYLFGTVFGGLLYLLVYNLFPELAGGREAILVGASAGVTAIFIGIATYLPNYEVKLAFIGYVKLWILAAVWVGIDLLQMTAENTGGHLAHLGGALFGFFYMRAYQGKDRTSIEFSKWFKFKKSPLKTVYKNPKKSKTKSPSGTKNNQEQTNTILEKISKSGYDSLSKEEKDFLFKQGN